MIEDYKELPIVNKEVEAVDSEETASLQNDDLHPVTLQRGSHGETTVAYLPSVYESSSSLAQEIRERRARIGSVATRSREGAMKRLGISPTDVHH